MYTAILLICLVSAGLSLTSSRIGRRKPTKRGRRITDVLAVILFFAAITTGWLGYRASIETEDQASDTIERVDRAELQITEIRTPRHMEPETKRILAASLKPFAGQKYDMKVFRDQDSLELATAIQIISCLSMKLSKAAETQRMSHRGFQSLCHIRVRTVQLPPTSL